MPASLIFLIFGVIIVVLIVALVNVLKRSLKDVENEEPDGDTLPVPGSVRLFLLFLPLAGLLLALALILQFVLVRIPPGQKLPAVNGRITEVVPATGRDSEAYQVTYETVIDGQPGMDSYIVFAAEQPVPVVGDEIPIYYFPGFARFTFLDPDRVILIIGLVIIVVVAIFAGLTGRAVFNYFA